MAKNPRSGRCRAGGLLWASRASPGARWVLAGIAVGTLSAERPPHRTVRAAFPHTAPTWVMTDQRSACSPTIGAPTPALCRSSVVRSVRLGTGLSRIVAPMEGRSTWAEAARIAPQDPIPPQRKRQINVAKLTRALDANPFRPHRDSQLFAAVLKQFCCSSAPINPRANARASIWLRSPSSPRCATVC